MICMLVIVRRLAPKGHIIAIPAYPNPQLKAGTALFHRSLQPGRLQRSPRGPVYGVPMKRVVPDLGQKILSFSGTQLPIFG